MADYSFELQTIMELQKTVSGLQAKTDRLIDDVKGQGGKLDALLHQASQIKGGLVVGGTLILAFAGLLSWFVSKWGDAVINAIKTIPK